MFRKKADFSFNTAVAILWKIACNKPNQNQTKPVESSEQRAARKKRGKYEGSNSRTALSFARDWLRWHNLHESQHRLASDWPEKRPPLHSPNRLPSTDKGT